MSEQKDTVRTAAQSPAFRKAVYPQAQEARAHLVELVGELLVEDATRLIAQLNNERDQADDPNVRQMAYLAASAVMIGIDEVCQTAESF